MTKLHSVGAGGWVGIGLILAIAVAAAGAGGLAPHDPTSQFREALLRPPAWSARGTTEFLLGTDAAGRDVWARILYGARLSLAVAAVVVALSLAIGGALGMVAGLAQGPLSGGIMRTMDVILAVPSLVLAMVVAVTLGRGASGAIAAITIVLVPGFARTVRGAVAAEQGKGYVLAGRALGMGTAWLGMRHILPAISGLVTARATLAASEAILGFAALGFLGLGANPPTPEWGTMVADAQPYVLRAWWAVVFPGVAIALTVLAFNLVGDALRDRFDPRSS